MMATLIKSLENIDPELAPIGQAALKHTMKCCNNEKQNIAANVETEDRNKFVQEVIKSSENLKKWKVTFYDINRQHFSPEDVAAIDEILESYNKKLSDFLETNTEL